jgi:hypothetical protein
MYPTGEKSKLHRDGPDEKHVGTGVAITIPGAEALETVLRVLKEKSPAEQGVFGRAGVTESG